MAAIESRSPYAFTRLDQNRPLGELENNLHSSVSTVWRMSSALHKTVDRTCELLEREGQVVALIQYGNQNVELEGGQIVDSFPIYSFLLNDPSADAKDDYRAQLLDRVIKLATQRAARGVHIELPSKDSSTIDFFKVNSFAVVRTFTPPASSAGEEKLSLLYRNLEQAREKRERSDRLEESSQSTKRHLRPPQDKDPLLPSSFCQESQYPLLPSPPPLSPTFFSQPSAALSSASPFGLIHELRVLPVYLQLIREGKKSREGRINNGRFSQIQAGEWIKFTANGDPSDFIYCQVIEKRGYPNFRSMLESEGVDQCLPATQTVDEGEKIYHSFPGYAENAQKHGVVAFELNYKEGFK